MSKLVKGDQIGPYPYRLIRQLGKGEGGMSIVYLASIGEVNHANHVDSDLVAIKIANVESKYKKFYRETLYNEIEYLRKLKHPGMVHLYAIRGQTVPRNPIYSAQTNLLGNPWFSVMEYLAGGSLADLLKRHQKLDVALALRITLMLAQTLEYIHYSNCVHLDIKPENIVFRKPLTIEAIDPVLIDFGIARAIGQGGLEAGTRIWLAPERLISSQNQHLPPEMRAKPHPSMDIYALGLLLYRMLAGRLPFQGSRKHVTSAILNGHPTAPSVYERTLRPEIDLLVLSAMAKEAHHRPSATHMAQELRELIYQPAYQTYFVPATAPLTDGADNGVPKKWLWLFLLLLLSMAMIAALWLPIPIPNPFEGASMTPTATLPSSSATPLPTPSASATPEPSLSATRMPMPTSTPVSTPFIEVISPPPIVTSTAVQINN